MSSLQFYKKAITENFPNFEVNSIDYLGRGKDYTVCLVNAEIIFRFPNHAGATEKLRKEIAFLAYPWEDALPLQVPRFHLIASTTSLFVGYKPLPGISLAKVPDIWDATWWQSSVGAFITALHRNSALFLRHMSNEERSRFPIESPAACRENIVDFCALVREHVFPLVNKHQQNAIAAYLDTYLDNPAHFDYEPVLLHADLHLAHIFADVERQVVTGIIDFSDVQFGDPARDMRNAWEPYYHGDRGSAWDDRRDFYWRRRWLGDIVFKNELIMANPSVVEDALNMIDTLWPSS